MKRSFFKEQKTPCWTTDQLVQLSESLEQSYGTGKVAKRTAINTGSWHYQQLLDMSAAKAQPFI